MAQCLAISDIEIKSSKKRTNSNNKNQAVAARHVVCQSSKTAPQPRSDRRIGCAMAVRELRSWQTIKIEIIVVHVDQHVNDLNNNHHLLYCFETLQSAGEVAIVKADVMLNWLHQQRLERLWATGLPGEGVVLKEARDNFTRSPATLRTHSNFFDQVVAMNVRFRRVLLEYSSHHNAQHVPLSDGLWLQVLPSAEHLPRCQKHHFAALIADEEILMVWDDEPRKLLDRASHVEDSLMKMICGGGEMAALDEKQKASANASTVELTERVTSPSELEDAESTEKRPTLLLNPIMLNRNQTFLPHVIIQMPVYKEGLVGVIQPTIISLKSAISTYELQGGTANIFVNDDGMQLIPEAEAQTQDGEKAFIRKGKFKKASNMNYALMISNKVEDKLTLIERSSGWTQEGEYVAYDQCLAEVLTEEEGRAWVEGKIRVGDYILLIDSDTRVPADCLLDTAIRYTIVSYEDEDGYEKFWSESHVSEDFGMSLRLKCPSYIIRGPFTPLFRKSFFSNIRLTSKTTILAYIGTYYAIEAAWILTLANYFLIS
ncbi:hypothetical protein G7Y89_g5069 [Cudoniella acicularis]|uniref:DUF7928 domain-containing protein n=1 Tax=Cudoniella acicularis TaxID=354080 RepID=A0A8H4W4C4_9HELO|nr:hypothetical protein G7Y89_g5069 [Cudoniella acicularis]